MTTAQDWMYGKITEDALAVLRSRIGTVLATNPESDPYTHAVIKRYLASVGDDNPLFWDDEYASGTRWGGVIAPPRMLIAGDPETPRSVATPLSEDAVTFMGEDVLEGVFAMVSGTRIVYKQPIRLGDRVHSQEGPHDVIERKSRMAGRSLELVNKVVYYNQREEAVATAYDSVIRMERSAIRENRKYLDLPEASYSAEEMERLYEQYENEQRRGSTPRYWEDTQVDEPLIMLAKGPLTIADISAYFLAQSRLFYTSRMKHLLLKANPARRLVNPETKIEDEWAAAHWDSFFAQQSGIPRPYDEGPMRYDNMAHLVTDWMGDDAVLREIVVSLRAPVLLGDVSWCTGKVAAKRVEDGHRLVDVHLWITNQRGDRTTQGSAIVELPTRG